MSRHGWKLAAGLVAVVTAWVLTGAAWNRSGAPEAELTLTERELPVAERFLWEESSGLSLRIVTTEGLPEELLGGRPDPLRVDERQLRSIGFDVALPAEAEAAQAKLRRQLERPAFAALEHDGAAWAERERRARAAASAGGEDRKEREAALERALHGASRLVVLEVGPDAAALRARHPDRRKVMVVPVRVEVWLDHDWRTSRCAPPACRVEARVWLRVDEVNVPRHLQAALPADPLPVSRHARGIARDPRYAVVLRVGRRYEPWVAELRPLAEAP